MMSRDDSFIPPLNYHDMRSMDSLRSLRSHDEKSALKAAAQQFEATFMNMLLKSMREANDVLGDDEIMGGDSVEFYQAMHDEQLAATLSAKGTLGLADLMVKQLSPSTAKETRINEVSAPTKTQDKSASVVSSPSEFVAAVKPHAIRAAKKLGIAPEALIAQAALETGWGKSLPHNGNNCFGIKADARWSGVSVARKTVEVENGVVQKTQARFRCYDNIAASFDDYANFVLADERYQSARQARTPESYLAHLAKAGYATDPHYVQKLQNVLNNDALRSDPVRINSSSSLSQSRNRI